MKTIQIALLVTLIAGCASAPGRIAGNYGVYFDSDFASDEQVVRALRDRLSSVDVVASPADDAYDAVIVLSRTATGRFRLQPDSFINPERRRDSPPSLDLRQQQMELVHYEIVRDGRTTAAGEVRVIGGYPTSDLMARRQRTTPGDRDSARLQQSYGRGIDIARSVVQALKGEG